MAISTIQRSIQSVENFLPLHQHFHDLTIFTSDKVALQTSALLLAVQSDFLVQPLKELTQQDSLVISVELESSLVQNVLDFLQFGVVPLALNAGIVQAFSTMGITLPDKEFMRVPLPAGLVKEEVLTTEEYNATHHALTTIPYEGAEGTIDNQGPWDSDADQGDPEGWNATSNLAITVKSEHQDAALEVSQVMREPSLNNAVVKESRKRKAVQSPENGRSSHELAFEDIRRGSGPWEPCTICKKMFADLPSHMEREHASLENRTCNKCQKVFESVAKRKKHTSSAHNDLCCEQCGKVLQNQNSLKNHMVNIHGTREDRPYKCDKCPSAFLHNSKLVEHIKGHQEARDHICEHCGKGWQSALRLHVHITQIHEGKAKLYHSMRQKKQQRPLQRKGERKKRPSKLRTVTKADGTVVYVEDGREFPNIRINSKMEHQCLVCQRIFKGLTSTRRALEHDLIKHGTEEDKKYQCHICSKRYVKPSTLKTHMDVHENKRKYQCAYCSVSFNFAGNRNAHEKSVHHGIKGKTPRVKGFMATAEEREERYRIAKEQAERVAQDE